MAEADIQEPPLAGLQQEPESSRDVARIGAGRSNESLRELFEQEENDLYTKLAQLPRTAVVRKVNDLIKRARLAKVLQIQTNPNICCIQ